MDKFWANVDRSDPSVCWEWTGTRSAKGYGVFSGVRAHRAAYELLVGPIPAGLTIDHLCRNRACINPAHLEPVTNRENILRGESPSAIHARASHCPKGHQYDGANTWTDRRGWRTCRECRRDRPCPICGVRMVRGWKMRRHRAVCQLVTERTGS